MCNSGLCNRITRKVGTDDEDSVLAVAPAAVEVPMGDGGGTDAANEASMVERVDDDEAGDLGILLFMARFIADDGAGRCDDIVQTCVFSDHCGPLRLFLFLFLSSNVYQKGLAVAGFVALFKEFSEKFLSTDKGDFLCPIAFLGQSHRYIRCPTKHKFSQHFLRFENSLMCWKDSNLLATPIGFLPRDYYLERDVYFLSFLEKDSELIKEEWYEEY